MPIVLQGHRPLKSSQYGLLRGTMRDRRYEMSAAAGEAPAFDILRRAFVQCAVTLGEARYYAYRSYRHQSVRT